MQGENERDGIEGLGWIQQIVGPLKPSIAEGVEGELGSAAGGCPGAGENGQRERRERECCQQRLEGWIAHNHAYLRGGRGIGYRAGQEQKMGASHAMQQHVIGSPRCGPRDRVHEAVGAVLT